MYMDKQKYFLEVFKKVEKRYGRSKYRLAADSWGPPWKTLITTIMSAQSRDETTIPIAEALFRKYGSLDKLANARQNDVLKILKSMNYNRTKAKHVIAAARYIKFEFKGEVPSEMEELVEIPGVGRKTANIVLTEVFDRDAICVDTHVHRVSNVFGFVETKTPEQTERALEELVPKRLWKKVIECLFYGGRKFLEEIKKGF